MFDNVSIIHVSKLHITSLAFAIVSVKSDWDPLPELPDQDQEGNVSLQELTSPKPAISQISSPRTS